MKLDPEAMLLTQIQTDDIWEKGWKGDFRHDERVAQNRKTAWAIVDRLRARGHLEAAAGIQSELLEAGIERPEDGGKTNHARTR